jgi:hypothetical protein
MSIATPRVNIRLRSTVKDFLGPFSFAITLGPIVLSLIVGIGTCKAEEPVKPSKEISDYIRSLGKILPMPTPVQENWTRVGDDWVRRTAIPIDFNQFVILDPNASTVWPGSVIEGGSLKTAGLTPIALSRRPITITMSNVRGKLQDGKLKSLVAKIDEPNAATVNDAIAQMLFDVDPASTTPQIAFNQVEFNSIDQAFVKIGASFSALSTAVRAQLESQDYSQRHNLMIDFSQRYFTVSVVPVGDPASFFAPDVDLNDIKALTASDNPPVYITDVAYGRRLILLFSSTATSDELRAAVTGSVNAVVASGDMSVSAAQKQVFDKTDLRGMVVGGNGVTAIGLFTGDSIAATLKQYLVSGGVLSPSSTGAPISFRANYLKDNSLADVQMLTFDREVHPAVATGYFLRWFNHFEPNTLYKVIANMERGRWGGNGNEGYKPYVVKLDKMPGRVLSEVEVAGDETFKRPENSWTAPPMNCPSLIAEGLHVMDDERWFLVQYAEDLPAPK